MYAIYPLSLTQSCHIENMAAKFIIVLKCLKVSNYKSPKISMGRRSYFSCTWKENKKKFRETRKRHNRKCLGVVLPMSSMESDGIEVNMVRPVARVIYCACVSKT